MKTGKSSVTRKRLEIIVIRGILHRDYLFWLFTVIFFWLGTTHSVSGQEDNKFAINGYLKYLQTVIVDDIQEGLRKAVIEEEELFNL